MNRGILLFAEAHSQLSRVLHQLMSCAMHVDGIGRFGGAGCERTSGVVLHRLSVQLRPRGGSLHFHPSYGGGGIERLRHE